MNYVAKTIIASIDFDGVLAQGVNAKIKYAKKWFGVDLTLEQTKKQGFNALMQKLGKQHTYRDLMDPLNEEHIMEYEVSGDCIPVLKKLYAMGFRFMIITSRNQHDYPYAVQFVAAKFPDLIEKIHNTRDEPKTKFVQRLKPRVHIDDDIKKLKQIEECPIELIYYRQSENVNKELPAGDKQRIHEAKNWTDISILLEQIKISHEAICWKNRWANKWYMIDKIWGARQSLSKPELQELLKEYDSFSRR
jgi:hypothetical protein